MYRHKRGKNDTLPKARLLVTVAVVFLVLVSISACASTRPQQQAQPPIFEEVNDVPADPTQVSFIAVGDVVAHDLLAFQGKIDDRNWNYDFIFENMSDEISSYDIAAITQETPFVTREEDVSGYPTFGTPWQMGEAMWNSGFDVIVGATNHSMDKGLYGINNTIDYWHSMHPNLLHLGMHHYEEDANSVSFLEKNGIKIGFTDCTYGLNGFVLPEGSEYMVDLLDDLDIICSNITAAQNDCDFIIAFVHMGEEYATVPSDEQREVAERLIDAGADVVIGSHVHVVQPMETVTTAAGNTGLVYYSIGNHVSNQIDVENMLGGAAIFTIEKTPDIAGNSKTEIVSYEFKPVVCHWNSATTTEYFLEDYTDELASQHAVNLSKDKLYSIWNSITGL